MEELAGGLTALVWAYSLLSSGAVRIKLSGHASPGVPLFKNSQTCYFKSFPNTEYSPVDRHLLRQTEEPASNNRALPSR
jgi:hypothetical protein